VAEPGKNRSPRYSDSERTATRTVEGLPMACTATSWKPSPPSTTLEALQLYSQLSHSLREQLGASASPATRKLYEQLLAGTLAMHSSTNLGLS
jgi:hypothetical protein